MGLIWDAYCSWSTVPGEYWWCNKYWIIIISIFSLFFHHIFTVYCLGLHLGSWKMSFLSREWRSHLFMFLQSSTQAPKPALPVTQICPSYCFLLTHFQSLRDRGTPLVDPTLLSAQGSFLKCVIMLTPSVSPSLLFFILFMNSWCPEALTLYFLNSIFYIGVCFKVMTYFVPLWSHV